MKTSPKKKEMSLRLRESRREEHKPQPSQMHQPDDDVESDLPIRGRPSKKLLLQQQQQRRQYQVKLEPDLKTVAAGAASTSSGNSGPRLKARRTLYKKSLNNGAASVKGAGESYVMRLFERSLDLSKYEENTPLYPICRAWMANQPRNPAVAAFHTEGSLQMPKREDNGEEILAALRNGEIELVTQLPAPKRTNLPVIPPRLEFGREDKRLQNASRSDLLAANMKRWKTVRAHWLKHERKYKYERYGIIDQIMSEICRPPHTQEV